MMLQLCILEPKQEPERSEAQLPVTSFLPSEGGGPRLPTGKAKGNQPPYVELHIVCKHPTHVSSGRGVISHLAGVTQNLCPGEMVYIVMILLSTDLGSMFRH